MRADLLACASRRLRFRSNCASRQLSSYAQRSLPEVKSATAFASRLDSALSAPIAAADTLDASDAHDLTQALDAAMITTHMHTQSRIAAFEGEGFYTIGPCGEELLSSLGLALRPTGRLRWRYHR